MKQLVLLGAVLLVSCRSVEGEVRRFHGTIPVRAEAPGTFPRQPQDVPLPVRKRIDEAETFRDLFERVEVVRLEAVGASIVGAIQDVVFAGGFWFVLDDLQGLVFQFTREGRFVRQLGKRGEGPGEYLDPSHLFACPQGVGFFDLLTAKIQIYDVAGDHLRTVSPRNRERVFIPNGTIVWPEPGLLFLPGFDSFNNRAPWHVALDPGKGDEVLFGFGERRIPIQKGLWPVTAFARIDDYLWVGSPYESQVEVYDLAGRHAATLPTAFPNGLQLADFKEINRNDKRAVLKLFARPRNMAFFLIGDLVLLQMGPLDYVIFDNAGNMLRTRLHSKTVGPVLYSGKDFAVAALPVFEEEAFYHPQDLKALQRTGWRFEDSENDNPYLWIGHLPK